MFGDRDVSRAINVKKLLLELSSLEINPDELWVFTSIKDLFSNARTDSDFRYAYSALLNYLTRNDEFDPNTLHDEPLIADTYPAERHALVACAVHFHLNSRNEPPPEWVYHPKYRITIDKNNKNKNKNPILSYHGLNIPLNEIGVVE